MLRIGELAAAAGTTPRTVRHYHSLGLLPEPARRGNGYREYDARALLRLVRVRRLAGLGLSLPEIRDALSGQDERELREVLAELVEDLGRQEATIRTQRQRLVALLGRERDLAVPAVLAEMLAEVRGLVPDGDLVHREGELLELLEATLPPEQFARLAEQYRAALGDPRQLARSVALARRFQALSSLEPADGEVAAVAAEFVALGRDGPFAQSGGAASGRSGAGQMWAAYQATLAPAQQRCLALAEQGWAS